MADEENITAAGVPVFLEIGRGAVGLMRRPKLKSLPQLRARGVTHLVTLLAEADATQLGKAAKLDRVA